jgi:AraC-like DNA-binding protein
VQKHLLISQKTANVVPDEQFIDLSLYYYGYEECPPSWTAGPFRREHFLFHYIFSGKGKFYFVDSNGKDNEAVLKKDQGFLLWPRQKGLYIADEKDPWVYAWVCFDGLKARELMIQAGLNYDHPLYTGANNESQEKMKNVLLSIVRTTNGLPLESIGQLYLFISALINSSVLQRGAIRSGIRDFYMRESIQFIEQHYHENINIEDVAAFCGINRSYLGKIFQNMLGASPHGFLLKYRINKACELLKITDMSIAEISAMVGYPNQFTFSRVFKNIQGKSPRDWRNDHKIPDAVKTGCFLHA